MSVCIYIYKIERHPTAVSISCLLHKHRYVLLHLINNAEVNLALLISLGHSDFHCFGYILGLILDSTLSSVLVF